MEGKVDEKEVEMGMVTIAGRMGMAKTKVRYLCSYCENVGIVSIRQNIFHQL